jgi:hypothetical protein
LRNELNIIDSRMVAWASCIHTHISMNIWFRCRHRKRGSAVLIDWAIPSLIMPIAINHSLHIIYWYLNLNVSFWYWAQVSLRGSKSILLKHGGLGHQPFSLREDIAPMRPI